MGATINILGAALRFAAVFTMLPFALTLVGQLLCSVAQCFLLAVPTTIAMVWFPEKEQTTACAIGGIFNQLGTAVCCMVL